MKHRIVLFYLLLITSIFSPCALDLQTFELLSNSVAAQQTNFALDPSLTIEWLTDNTPSQTITGYKIWESQGAEIGTLLEETYITTELTLTDVTQACMEQSVHYIAPLMLFVENSDIHTFYDISAKETLPEFLFEEIRLQKRDSMPTQHEISPQNVYTTTDADNYYVYQTPNYYAEFTVIPHTEDDSVNYHYKVVDPIDRQQYSLVYDLSVQTSHVAQ